MHRLLAIAFVATVALAAEEKTVKNATARGYYGTGPAADYPQEAPQTQPIYYPVYPPPPRLEDRNVCDLDASVLLVTNHRRHHGHHDHHGHHGHHHGNYKAIRVRCSEIASYDEDSCNACCQSAARRDRNLPNSAMFGFLAAVDDDDHKHKKDHSKENSNENDNEEEDERRKKRGSDFHHDEFKPEEVHLKVEQWSPNPDYKNLKCVCCAPKRPLPIFQFPVPPYGQAPAQPYQPQQSPPLQGYQQQAQSPPLQAYQAPAQSPPQGYQPTWQQPAASPPAYQPPQQSPPVYQPPQQSPPAYQPPQQSPTSY